MVSSDTAERQTAAIGLDARQTEAAQLVYRAELTTEQIAEKIGIARSTLWEWRRLPAFHALVDELRNADIERTKALASRYSAQALAALVAGLRAENEETRRRSAVNLLEAVGVIDKGAKQQTNVAVAQPCIIEWGESGEVQAPERKSLPGAAPSK